MLLYASAKWSAAKRGSCMHIYLRSGQCSTREQKACSKAMILRKEARLTSSKRLPSPKRFSSRYVQRASMCRDEDDDPLPACFAGRAKAGGGGRGCSWEEEAFSLTGVRLACQKITPEDAAKQGAGEKP